MNPSRRNLLKAGGVALALIPVVAFATKNDSMRASTKYKDSPEGEKRCGDCVQFSPGKSPKDLGVFKIYPADTEISPDGSCIAWSKKP